MRSLSQLMAGQRHTPLPAILSYVTVMYWYIQMGTTAINVCSPCCPITHPLIDFSGDNTGYKDADPSRPCQRCWGKYARPFSGPLAYSFSLNPSEGVFQRPLPIPVYRPFDPPGAFPPPFPPQPIGFGSPPPIIHVGPSGPPNAVIYNAGDPRIGGVLCWVCGGKGRINLILLNIDCEMCNGVGRTFP